MLNPSKFLKALFSVGQCDDYAYIRNANVTLLHKMGLIGFRHRLLLPLKNMDLSFFFPQFFIFSYSFFAN